MAFASSSSSFPNPNPHSFSNPKPQWKYDVFINFRGEDTRKKFVSHLYHALSKIAGVNTFLDEENLLKGMQLTELTSAIEGSQIALVVFSKTYAGSTWCLRELEKIIECLETKGQRVVPVFYYIDPSEVRHQKGDFGKALKAAARKDELSRWRRALTKAADLSGWDARNYGNEAELVNKIVDDVQNKLVYDILSITKFPVGLESRAQEVIRLIENRSTEVCIIGIWGMGGSGKTTVAKAIYNKIHRRFMEKSFIEDVREICQTDRRGLVHLQEQLLSDFLKIKVEIYSVGKGTTMIENRLAGKRALIVLDDVNDFDQLDALCRNPRWIGKGSVIIITTRDRCLLERLDVDYVYVYEMKEMDAKESLELFSWHAFREAKPREDFKELAIKLVAYCGGPPLALEDFGSSLINRPMNEWRSVLSKPEIIPNAKVQKILKKSFDGLRNEIEMDIFLDVCCVFIGKDRGYVTDILNGCRLPADIGIAVLIERSLIKVDKNNKIRMHHLLRVMGREIIRGSSPKEPGKHSRLWSQEDVLDVLSKNTGTEAIEGLALKLHLTNTFCFKADAFEEMRSLRLLRLHHVELAGDYGYLPKQLRWIYWKGFTLKCIPNNFFLEGAIAIDFKRSNLELVWKEPKVLQFLKILNLSHSKYLTETPDFSKLPTLEKLILKDCPSLCKVHQSIGDLHNLLLINLKDCTSLSNLPREIYMLKSLKTLILSGCSNIDKLGEDIDQMESLTTLIAVNTAVKQVPFSIVRSKKIGYISLCGYEGLVRDVFPSLIWSWMSPTKGLVYCIQSFGSMSTSIVTVDIQDNNLGNLLSKISEFSTLRSISVRCDSDIQLTQELILDNLCNLDFAELETTYASQVSENSMVCRLIGMGSNHQVIDMLNKIISEGLTTHSSSDLLLPGNNYPYWLAYTGEGYSVHFQVPDDSDCRMKGMILCVVYSSTPENIATESLSSVFIFNYTKCTIQIYKQTTAMTFTDEDWQGVLSNLGSGDNVEIFVAFGHGMTAEKTAVYLIYGQSITMRMEPSPEVSVQQPSPDVEREPSPEVIVRPSPHVEMEPSSEESVQPSPDVEMGPSPEVSVQPSPDVEREPSPEVIVRPSPDVEMEPSLIVQMGPTKKPKKNILPKISKKMRVCLCLN